MDEWGGGDWHIADIRHEICYRDDMPESEASPVNILIVDDVAANVRALRKLLNGRTYHLMVADGVEAAQQLLSAGHAFAMVLMGAKVPGMSGMDSVKLIKSHPQCADTAVLFLSRVHQADHMDSHEQSDESGAMPYDPDALLSKVEAFAELYRIRQAMKAEIGKRKQSEHKLRLASQVFEHAGEGIMVTDQDCIIEAVNPAFETITGYSAVEAIGQTPSMLSSGRHTEEFYHQLWAAVLQDGIWEGEVYNRRKNGDIYAEWLKIVVVRNSQDEIINYIGSFSDITAHTSARQRLYHLAHYDSVTDLPNRVKFKESLEHELINARRRGSTLAVFFLDLDHFKTVNDTLGHAAGDVLLREVSRRLLACKRENDLVARQGGDEFTGILVDLARVEDAAIVAGRMLTALAEPIRLGKESVHISGSIGLSIYPNDGEDVEALTSKADTAMYHAKENGRNNYQFHTEQMYRNSVRRIELEAKLRHAIKHNEFELYYQPQIDTGSKRVIGMETLIRWNHPVEGMISPAEFIPLAEETGLIVTIGEWVLRTACAQGKQWLDQGLPALMLSVNLSSHQFRKKDFMRILHAALADSGFPPQSLKLELTESIIMQEDDFTIARLQTIHDAGIHLSIDDFGTGYSSMSYLKRFPLNELKIDKSFIRDLCRDEDDGVIVSAMINLAHGLKLSVIAEGVEEKSQLNWLEWHGCDSIQGYYFSRPLPVDAFENFMRQQGTGGQLF